MWHLDFFADLYSGLINQSEECEVYCLQRQRISISICKRQRPEVGSFTARLEPGQSSGSLHCCRNAANAAAELLVGGSLGSSSTADRLLAPGYITFGVW